MTLAIAGLVSAAAGVAGTPAAGPAGTGDHPAAFPGPALVALSASPPGISGPVTAVAPAPATGPAAALGPAVAVDADLAAGRAPDVGPGPAAGPGPDAGPGPAAGRAPATEPARDASAADDTGDTGSEGAAGGKKAGGAVLARYSASRQHSAYRGDAPLAQTPRAVARQLLDQRFHWRGWQFKYLDRLWNTESGWNRYASNPYSGAYGIPQALPGSKMSSAGPGWRWNFRTQILWGMTYIRDRYRTPYWAWRHEAGYGWY